MQLLLRAVRGHLRIISPFSPHATLSATHQSSHTCHHSGGAAEIGYTLKSSPSTHQPDCSKREVPWESRNRVTYKQMAGEISWRMLFPWYRSGAVLLFCSWITTTRFFGNQPASGYPQAALDIAPGTIVNELYCNICKRGGSIARSWSASSLMQDAYHTISNLLSNSQSIIDIEKKKEEEKISMFRVGLNEAAPSSTFHYDPKMKCIGIFVSCNAGRERILIFHKPPGQTKLCKISIWTFPISKLIG